MTDLTDTPSAQAGTPDGVSRGGSGADGHVGRSTPVRLLRDSPHPYCPTCGVSAGRRHWAGCPDDRSQWVGEMRHYALHDGWV